ncbi:MAG: family 43 glycosylhydrolase [Muribaculaceae bacterium]|nr:family 43 glycosylhydrolase [Muribaculaceae bacterium]
MRQKLSIALSAWVACICGQNPIIHNQFTADPTARVFNGRMYLYPSHDIVSPVEELKNWFCMEDYHVFSSDNLVDWTDHGVILTQNRIPWVKPDSYAMWAPDCIEKDGRYYFYYPAATKDQERGFGIGVAVADSPEGPFLAMPRPIKGVMGIDPCVMNDDDGKSYIFWSGMGLSVARLKDNMMELDTEPVKIQGLPDGFKEGPFAFKHNEKYYLTFPWVRNDTETLAYAIADDPFGPYEFKGIIMDESPTGCWTNHHSLVEKDGQWYLFYHHNDYSPEMDKRRSTRIDTLTFNPDGTINKVIPTLRGVGISDARKRIQIDRYSDADPDGIALRFIDPDDTFMGWAAVFSRKGGWIRYDRIDFGNKPVNEVTLRILCRKGCELNIYDKTENLIADVRIPAGREWQEVSVPVSYSPRGVTDITVRMKKGLNAEIDWIGFDALPFESGAMSSGIHRNYFMDLGYSEQEIDTRLNNIFEGVFFGPDRVYFEADDTTAYISDIKNNDVRTEGMSYGMMIAVQLDKKDIFDKLWRWAKKHMQHHDGPNDGYFAWSCKTDGTRNAQGSASDGELFFITSLIFASNRWGDDTGIDYKTEARNILDKSMMKTGMDRVSPLINVEKQLITFTPDPWGGRYTDPSYHIPAFYDVWAAWADDGRSEFWKSCADKSREYLHKAVHQETGLTPDYSAYDGSPRGSHFIIGDDFRFDSWRVPLNIAIDFAWSGADAEWQREYADRIHDFFYNQGIDTYADQYKTDGSQVDRVLGAGEYQALRHSLGLVSTLGAVAIAATDLKSREFAERLWDSEHKPYEDGYFDAYYDGLLRLFSFMLLSGKYQVIPPSERQGDKEN